MVCWRMCGVDRLDRIKDQRRAVGSPVEHGRRTSKDTVRSCLRLRFLTNPQLAGRSLRVSGRVGPVARHFRTFLGVFNRHGTPRWRLARLCSGAMVGSQATAG
jgi:hypothetical protein